MTLKLAYWSYSYNIRINFNIQLKPGIFVDVIQSKSTNNMYSIKHHKVKF